MKKLRGILFMVIGSYGAIHSMDVSPKVVVLLADGQEQAISKEDFDKIRACVDGLSDSMGSKNVETKIVVELADKHEETVSKEAFDKLMALSSESIRELLWAENGRVSLHGLAKESLNALIKHVSILKDEKRLHHLFDSLCQESHSSRELAALFQGADFLGIESLVKALLDYLYVPPDSMYITRRLDNLLKLDEESDQQVITGLLALPCGIFSLTEFEADYGLKAAARKGSQEIATLLLDREVGQASLAQAMSVAAGAGHTEIMSLLLEKGAKNHAAALIAAARNGQTKVVLCLLDKGFAVDIDDEYGSAALMYAARYGHTEMVRLLLERGAALERKNKLGNNALLWAAMNGHTETVRVLLDQGAFIDVQNTYGNTPLMEAVRNGHSDSGGTVCLLLERKAQPDLQDRDGLTALMKAAGCGDTNSVSYLLKAGARTNLTDNSGNTARVHASLRWNVARSEGPWRVAEGCKNIMSIDE